MIRGFFVNCATSLPCRVAAIPIPPGALTVRIDRQWVSGWAAPGVFRSSAPGGGRAVCAQQRRSQARLPGVRHRQAQRSPRLFLSAPVRLGAARAGLPPGRREAGGDRDCADRGDLHRRQDVGGRVRACSTATSRFFSSPSAFEPRRTAWTSPTFARCRCWPWPGFTRGARPLRGPSRWRGPRNEPIDAPDCRNAGPGHDRDPHARTRRRRRSASVHHPQGRNPLLQRRGHLRPGRRRDRDLVAEHLLLRHGDRRRRRDCRRREISRPI